MKHTPKPDPALVDFAAVESAGFKVRMMGPRGALRFNAADYETGYWCARSKQAGRFLSASMRVGYQHGTVDRALDYSEVTGDLRGLLGEVSAAHNAWRSAAAAGNREGQGAADVLARDLMSRLTDETLLETVSPGLWARVHIAPGIHLVL